MYDNDADGTDDGEDGGGCCNGGDNLVLNHDDDDITDGGVDGCDDSNYDRHRADGN